jgi:hypothetical protein
MCGFSVSGNDVSRMQLELHFLKKKHILKYDASKNCNTLCSYTAIRHPVPKFGESITAPVQNVRNARLKTTQCFSCSLSLFIFKYFYVSRGSGMDDWVYWHFFYYNCYQLKQVKISDSLSLASFLTGLRVSSLPL